jgi:lipoprotein NlpD
MKRHAISLLALLLLVGGCTSTRHRAPVEDRTTSARPAASAPAPVPAASGPAAPASAPAVTPPSAPAQPAAEGYVVKPGDTLIRIGLDSGQNWRDIARWNGLEEPFPLKVGQSLRVSPPEGQGEAAPSTTVAAAPRNDVRPPASPVAASGAAAAAPAAAATPAAATPAAANTAAAESGPVWSWPAAGPVLAGFNEVSSKGLSIGGNAGDAVTAAADGRVVYAGSGLRGYGNLVIVKHDATFLTAYAHNQSLVVKEDQVVRRGQKIAEMGSTDADRVKLHFEIRRQGKPVDPARYLPAR